MPLRDYQQKLVDDALDAICTGKNPLVVLPPGGGKTHVMAAILEQFKRTLSIAHRVELTSKLKKLLPSDAHKVATVQSGIESLGPLELLAIDEAHHAPAKTYQRIIDDVKGPVLGVTATPCRMDGRGLGSIFDVLLEGPDVAALTEMGYLMPFDLYSAKTEIDVAGISKGVSGDYAPGSAAKAATARTITADAVQEWLGKADGRQTIVFTCTVGHARQVQQQYLRAGIRAEVITGNSKDRHELLPAFERKEFPVLINCEIAIEGIDIPSCECVQILRPTNSIRIYDQMIGRLLRPSGRRGVILDHAHTWERLGYPFAGRTWSLDGVEIPESELRVCPECGAVVQYGDAECSACGHEFSRGQDRARVVVPAFRAGDLEIVRELELLKAEAAKLRFDGLGDREIGRRLGVTHGTVSRWLGKNPKIPDRPPQEKLKALAAEMKAQGLPYRAICKKLRISQRTVNKWLGKSDYGDRDLEPFRDQSFELRSQGLSNRAIGRRLGVSNTVVNKWLGRDPGSPDRDELKIKAIEMESKGFSRKVIRKTLRVGHHAVTEWLGKKISRDQLLPKAIELRGQGLSYAAIGKTLGLSDDTVGKWLRELPDASTASTLNNSRAFS